MKVPLTWEVIFKELSTIHQIFKSTILLMRTFQKQVIKNIFLSSSLKIPKFLCRQIVFRLMGWKISSLEKTKSAFGPS